MKSERFICACRTLYVMLISERWYEAKSIVLNEIKWEIDPPPPYIYALYRQGKWINAWERVHKVLEAKCNDRSER